MLFKKKSPRLTDQIKFSYKFEGTLTAYVPWTKAQFSCPKEVGIPEGGCFRYKGFLFILCDKYPIHVFPFTNTSNSKYPLIYIYSQTPTPQFI